MTANGNQDAGGVPHIEELTAEECLRLLAPSGIGRVAFTDMSGPAVVPVNYVVDAVEGLPGEGDRTSVVFRTSLSGWLNQHLTTSIAGADVRIAFEVDHIDAADETGWSVLLRGGAHHLASGGDLSERVRPWAGGEKEAYVRIIPTEITGRRIIRG